jgi:hypothetical protein
VTLRTGQSLFGVGNSVNVILVKLSDEVFCIMREMTIASPRRRIASWQLTTAGYMK